MASVVITGDTSGSVTLEAPAVAGTTTLTLPATSGTFVTANSSGNVGIGTSSPTAVLDVYSASGTQIQLHNSTTGSASTDGTRLELSGSDFRIVNRESATMQFYTADTERMRIASDGSVGIGITNPNSFGKLAVNGSVGIAAGNYAYFYNGANSNYSAIACVDTTGMAFYTASTERMRITSAGNVGIGTSSPGARIHAEADIYAARFVATNATAGTEVIVQSNLINSNNATSSDYLFLGGINGGADRVYILGNGNLQNINNSYGTLSDVKLKENIVDANPKLDDVMKLQVRNFNLKTDPSQKQIGFVAQELETVFPGLIEEVSELDEDKKFTGNKVKGIKTTVLIPILVKAIQELKSELDSVKATVEAQALEIQALKGTE